MDTLKKLLKEPIVYVIMILVVILLILLCPLFGFQKHNSTPNVTTQTPTTTINQKHNSSIGKENAATTTQTPTTTITQKHNSSIGKESVATTTQTPTTTITNMRSSSIGKESAAENTTTISQIDGYYTIKKERDYVSVQKRCHNCVKLYFNKTQLLEITRFLHGCFFEGKCDPTGFTQNPIYCLVCNPSISLRYSGLTFCIDFNQNLNSAFIGSYVFYSDLLYALYKFRNVL